MSSDLIEFFEIKNLFIEYLNNNCKYKYFYIREINNLTIEHEIISQLLIFISIIMKKQQTYQYYNENEVLIEKKIITESNKLLKKIKYQYND
jgi:hypothetical protein